MFHIRVVKMPKTNCLITYCPSKSGDDGISIHCIPADRNKREKWLSFIEQAGNTVVHIQNFARKFASECNLYFEGGNYRKDAVPSRFQPGKLSKSVFLINQLC